MSMVNARSHTEEAEGWPSRSIVCLGLGAAAVATLAVAPMVMYPILVMKILCFALFAASFNLLIGYVGLLSFGHAAFFGGGAYVAAHAAKVWGLTPEAAILAGTGFAAALGSVIGFLAIRRHGIYFSMITLALSQMFYFFCAEAPFTGGEDGIQGVPRGKLFGLFSLADTQILYLLVVFIFLGGILTIVRIVHSPFGNILKAIRENESRAISLGYRVERYKLGAFVISAALAGLAGGTKAIVFQLASLTDVAFHMSGEVVMMTLLGGIGTMLGPIVGAAFVVTLSNYLASSSFPVPVLIGSVFIVCVLVFQRGIIGEAYALAAGWSKFRKARQRILQSH
jgi:branched-chain amino acid transport system permease protein